MAIRYLHLYGPFDWHDDVYIVGTREAVQALRDALDQALASPAGSATCGAFAADGEGFDTCVKVVSEEEIAELHLPYSDEIASGGNDRRRPPVFLFPERFVKVEG